MSARTSRGFATVVTLLVIAGTLGSEAAGVWTAESRLETSVVDPGVYLEEGDGARDRRHFRHFELNAQGTRFTTDVKGRSGAEVVVTEVLRVVENASADADVTLSGTQVTDTRVEALTWTVRDAAGNALAVLDYGDASPEASFHLPAGAVHTMDLRIRLAEGAGKSSQYVGFDLRTHVAGSHSDVTYGESNGTTDPDLVDVVFGALAAGSDAGEEGTNATAHVEATLLSTTTEILWLNNTHPGDALLVRLELARTSLLSLDNLEDLEVGTDNGTRVAQIKVKNGVLEQAKGSHVRLGPGESMKVYVTRDLLDAGLGSTVRFLAVTTDDPGELSVVKTRGAIHIG